MARRSLITILGVYLLFVGFFGTVAFRIGEAHGESWPPGLEAGANDVDKALWKKAVSAPDRAMTDCADLGHGGVPNRFGAGAECLEAARRISEKSLAWEQKSLASPLRQAVIRKIAQSGRKTSSEAPHTPTGGGVLAPATPGAPFSIALAPDGRPVDLPADWPASWPAGPSGVPASQIPSILAAASGDPNGPQFPFGNGPTDALAPDLATPIPGALPLLITGAMGLLAASRRKKRRHQS